MDEKKDIENWFQMQAKEVQKNSRIVSKEEVGTVMLHIDKNMPKNFIPRFPASAGDTENRTCSRITVAPTILGCCIGYSRIEIDFMDGPNKKISKDPYRAGYDLSVIDYSFAIEPNKKLVFDQLRSEEHWLVSYNKETVTYKPLLIGKLFFTQLVYNAAKTSDKIQMPCATMKGYLYHEYQDGIMFKKDCKIMPGYYEIELFFEDPGNYDIYEKNENHRILPISKGKYEEAKNTHASMLSFHQYAELKKLKFSNW